jgi:hypothetical protein
MDEMLREEGPSARHLVDLAAAHGWQDGTRLRPGMQGFDAAVQAVGIARDLWGKAAGVALWNDLGLPPPRPLAGCGARQAGPDDAAARQVRAFAEEALEGGGTFSVSAADIWAAYVAWCDRHDEATVTTTMLGLRLGRLGYPSMKERGRRRYRGVRVRPA